MKQIITLPFNPLSKTKDAKVTAMTPAMARIILTHHNGDNRQLFPSQVNKIAQSVKTSGWLFDGNPIAFNYQGNLTEGQHRLKFIATQDDGEYDVVVVVGVEPDTFSNAALGKARRPHDEIYRKDKTAKASQTAALGDIMKRRKGERFTINTAVRNWEDWKDEIIKGEDLCNTFLSGTSDYSSQTKTIVAWASLCVNAKYADQVEAFLDLLKDQVNEKGVTRLTKDFYETFKDLSWNMGNEPKLTLMYNMLCLAMDRFLERPDGAIALNYSITNSTNSKCYRKFLA
tara:strand:- start:4084 stop:4941 length:858 start_codon:yes stop_codon:yes gene_type:complete